MSSPLLPFPQTRDGSQGCACVEGESGLISWRRLRSRRLHPARRRPPFWLLSPVQRRLTCPGPSSSHDPCVCPRDQRFHLRKSVPLNISVSHPQQERREKKQKKQHPPLPAITPFMDMLEQSLDSSARWEALLSRFLLSHGSLHGRKKERKKTHLSFKRYWCCLLEFASTVIVFKCTYVQFFFVTLGFTRSVSICCCYCSCFTVIFCTTIFAPFLDMCYYNIVAAVFSRDTIRQKRSSRLWLSG